MDLGRMKKSDIVQQVNICQKSNVSRQQVMKYTQNVVGSDYLDERNFSNTNINSFIWQN